MVTSYTVFPEERIESEFHYLAHIWGKYLRKVFLFLKYGPPHPVKATLKNQGKTREVPPSNAGFQPWKFLIRDNHQPVRPWSTTTNGANKEGKKEFLWQPQRPRIPQKFRTGSPYGRAHYGRRPATTTMSWDLIPNAGKTGYQEMIVTIENCARSRRPQMATVRWLTWKGVDEIQG